MSNVVKFSVTEAKTIKGDCNADGEFSVADVVLLQKWLLTEEKSMPDWKAADLCEDDRLDVFDLCMMKRMLVENTKNSLYLHNKREYIGFLLYLTFAC